MRRRDSEWLLLVVAIHVVVLGMELPAPWQDLANLAALLLQAALLARLTGRPRDGWVVLALGSAGPLLNFAVPWREGARWLDLLKVAAWAAAPAFMLTRLLAHFTSRADIRRHELAGAVTIYLLLGLFFANILEAVFLLDPQALRIAGTAGVADARSVAFSEVLYFSYVTLATVGYGDIVPAHPAARVVVVLEAITGLMLVSIVIARFVSLHAARREDPRRGSE